MRKQGSRTIDTKLTRLEAQTRMIRSVNKLLFALVALALGGAALATWIPQRRELAELEKKLALVEREEKEILEEKAYRQAELEAMATSPEFVELKALDRLPLHRPGEKIYRMQREP